MMTRLVADHRAPRAARAFVAGALAAGRPPHAVVVDDVVLIASELVTNAVRAGAAWVDLSLRVTSMRVDLVVTDDARGLPVLAAADREAVGGRGLRIVEDLADTWAVTPKETGKVVTATWLDRAAHPPR